MRGKINCCLFCYLILLIYNIYNYNIKNRSKLKHNVYIELKRSDHFFVRKINLVLYPKIEIWLTFLSQSQAFGHIPKKNKKLWSDNYIFVRAFIIGTCFNKNQLSTFFFNMKKIVKLTGLNFNSRHNTRIHHCLCV